MPRITDNHIETALHEARKSPVKKKFGAILIHNGRIVSTGYNYYTSGLTDDARHYLLCS